MKFKRFLITLFFFSFIFSNTLIAEDTTPEPYNTEEFPQTLKDLRRFEIISLGAMPFVTLDVTIGYSCVKWYQNGFSSEYIPNPFSKNAYTPEEQKKIILTSLGISCGVGLTDYIVRLIKRVSAEKKQKQAEQSILITPISEDPDAIKLDIPHIKNIQTEQNDLPENPDINVEYTTDDTEVEIIEEVEQ